MFSALSKLLPCCPRSRIEAAQQISFWRWGCKLAGEKQSAAHSLLLFAGALCGQSWFREYCRLAESTSWIQESLQNLESEFPRLLGTVAFLYVLYKQKCKTLLNDPRVHPLTLGETSVINLCIHKSICIAFKKYWGNLLCLKAEIQWMVAWKTRLLNTFKLSELLLQITKTYLQPFFLNIWMVYIFIYFNTLQKDIIENMPWSECILTQWKALKNL